MRKILLASCTVLLLVGCQQNSDRIARYTLKLDLAGIAEKKTELINASQRVTQRVVESMGQKVEKTALDTKGADPVLSLTLASSSVVGGLTDVLTSGFSFRVMEEVPVGSADVTVDNPSGKMGFKETGITEKDVVWVTASKAEGGTQGQVELQFAPRGLQVLSDVFKRDQGKTIGIFVRKKLVSTMKVEAAQPKEVIVISGVPSLLVAQVFADDVNVGVHTTFVPLANGK